MLPKKPANRTRQRTSQPGIAAQHARQGLSRLILRRETILQRELTKVGIIKDSGQSLDLKATKKLQSGTLFSYTLPPIGGCYSSFLGRVARGNNGKPVFILTHKSNDGIYSRLASPIQRKLTRGVRRSSMLIEVKLLSGKIGVKKRAAVKPT